jgi:hypothetical protein
VIATYVKQNLKAFIDDNLCLWNNDFGPISIINEEFRRIEQNEGIKFVMVEPTVNLSEGKNMSTQFFLDLCLHLTPSTITIDQYDKSAHNFVSWSSCHPPHTGRNIPYSLALRTRTICDCCCCCCFCSIPCQELKAVAMIHCH